MPFFKREGVPGHQASKALSLRGQGHCSVTPSASENVLLGPEAPRVAAVKKLNLVHRGKCRGFFVKFFAAIFPGNWRTKISEKFRQNFGAFFADLFEKFRKNFALGGCGHNVLRRCPLAARLFQLQMELQLREAFVQKEEAARC